MEELRDGGGRHMKKEVVFQITGITCMKCVRWVHFHNNLLIEIIHDISSFLLAKLIYLLGTSFELFQCRKRSTDLFKRVGEGQGVVFKSVNNL